MQSADEPAAPVTPPEEMKAGLEKKRKKRELLRPWYTEFENWLVEEYTYYWGRELEHSCFLIRFDILYQDFYVYDPEVGYWVIRTKVEMEKIYINWCDENDIVTSDKDCKHILTRLRAKTLYTGEWNPREFLGFTNAVFHKPTRGVLPFSPDFNLTRGLPVPFIPNPQIPCWEKIRAAYPEQTRHVETMLQRSMFRDTSEELMVYLVGGTQTGKGTTLQVVEAIFGRDFAGTRQLHEIAADNFALAYLRGKFVNIDREGIISAMNAKTMAKLKDLITGEGYVSLRDLYKQAVNIKIEIVFWAAANQFGQLPPSTDKSAFFRRTDILVYNQTMPSDPTFKAAVLAETPHIASYIALNDYPRLKPADIDAFSRQNEELWDDWSDPVRQFIKNTFQHTNDNGAEIPAYAAFLWCAEALDEQRIGLAPHFIKTAITTNMKRLGGNKKATRKNGHNYAFYRNVEPIKPEYKAKLKEFLELEELAEEEREDNRQVHYNGKKGMNKWA